MRLFLISLLLFNASISANATTKTVLVSEYFNLSESHFFQNDTTDFLVKAFKKGHSKDEIVSIPKGSRPNPSNYLKWRYRHRHQRNFRRGASFLTQKHILDKYGRTMLGRQDGLFVMCKKEMNDLLQKANGQLSYVETELGIPAGMWKNSEIIRIDIRRPKKLKLRLPSGNETGANELWIPGGKLPNGYMESVINPVPEGKYTETTIILK
ncbi:hypothetical protein [Emticicia aquatilis]|nr:hypothetical protein [Emticicia aquatilis]